MNNNVTRNAIHAPHNAIWRVTTLTYPWGNKQGHSDPSIAPMAFMDELAANASANGVGMIWYSGNDDALTTHFSTEVAIQVCIALMSVMRSAYKIYYRILHSAVSKALLFLPRHHGLMTTENLLARFGKSVTGRMPFSTVPGIRRR
jgi:hypothetical protein